MKSCPAHFVVRSRLQGGWDPGRSLGEELCELHGILGFSVGAALRKLTGTEVALLCLSVSRNGTFVWDRSQTSWGECGEPL